MDDERRMRLRAMLEEALHPVKTKLSTLEGELNRIKEKQQRILTLLEEQKKNE